MWEGLLTIFHTLISVKYFSSFHQMLPKRSTTDPNLLTNLKGNVLDSRIHAQIQYGRKTMSRVKLSVRWKRWKKRIWTKNAPWVQHRRKR